MKIRTVNIENYRAIKNRRISFKDPLGRIRPITVLAGPNGCGKTSVVSGIVRALMGVMGYRTDDVPPPSKQDVHSSGEPGKLSPEPPCARVTLDVEFQEAEREAIRRVFEDTQAESIPSLPDLPNGRIRATWKYPPDRNEDGTLKPFWFLSGTDPWRTVPWFRGRVEAIRGWRKRQLSSRKLLDNIGGIYLFPQDRNLQSRVVGDREELTERPGANTSADADDEQKHTAREKPVWGILQYLSSYVRADRDEGHLPAEENWEKRIMEAFKRICGPREYAGFLYQRDDPVGAPYFRHGNVVYPLQQAASGEQVILEYLVRLTYPSPMNHSVILIDEPEIHLHPKWIRQLYRALPQIGADNQFILTTHSLELREMAAEDGSLVDMGELEDHS